MAEQDAGTPTQAARRAAPTPTPAAAPAQSSGGSVMGPWSIGLVTVYLVLLSLMVVHGLVVLWPPDRDRQDDLKALVREAVAEQLAAQAEEPAPPPAAEPDQPSDDVPGGGAEPSGEAETETPEGPAGEEPEGPAGEEPAGPRVEGEVDAESPPATPNAPAAAGAATPRTCSANEEPVEFLWLEDRCLGSEERLFLIVLLAGALGGLVHAARSFYWYLGNRKLVLSWMGMYITLPFVGGAMAIVFYLVVRAGFTPTDSSVDPTNPFGFAALAALIGMFTEQASQRLKRVAETVLAGAEKGRDHAGPPELGGVEPASGPLAGGTKVTITGANLTGVTQVRFGAGEASTVERVDDTTIRAVTPAADAAGTVTVEVTVGSVKASLPNAFTYTAA